MNFISPEFVLFFSLVLVCNFLLREKGMLYRLFFVACNAVFYAYAGPRFLLLLLHIAIVAWGTGKLLANATSNALRRTILFFSVMLNLSALAIFKYYEFFTIQAEWLVSSLGDKIDFPLLDLALPVGLSFYTFQGISYCIDQFREERTPPQSFLNVLMYVSFFPTVMSGPIMRGHAFWKQMDRNQCNESDIREGCLLILSGLFKKLVIATYLSEHVVRNVFLVPDAYSSAAALVAVYGYAIEIFCDFSGYSDLAVGIARLLGWKLPENFQSPYMALNLQDFWRRWHITLSMWLRDYLYIPLGGNRRGNRYLNLLVTMTLGGLWHGAHMRFLFWGIGHGLGLAVTHAFQQWKKRCGIDHKPGVAGTLLGWFLTFHFVAFLWIFFRAENMDIALGVIGRIAGGNLAGEGFPVLALMAIAVGLAMQGAGPFLFRRSLSFLERLPVAVQACVFFFFTTLFLRMGPEGELPFIYFQF